MVPTKAIMHEKEVLSLLNDARQTVKTVACVAKVNHKPTLEHFLLKYAAVPNPNIIKIQKPPITEAITDKVKNP